MCVVCWQEFDDSTNPPVDLGCGHFGCGTCRDAITVCPVCHAPVAATPDSNKPEPQTMGGGKRWSTPRRRVWSMEEQLSDLLDDDHLAPTTLGSADAATPPLVRMLERAPSSAASSVHSRTQPSAAVVSAKHLALGSLMAGRAVLGCTLVPAARVSFHVSRTLVSTTYRAATGTSWALVRAACRLVRFAAAPRHRIIGFDGSQQQRADGHDPSEASTKQASRGHGRCHRHHPHKKLPCPEPVSNVVGGRITLRDCRHTRLRIEYCRDCVVVASGLESVELLMVCCQRVKLVMRNCNGLLLRELQCSAMADFVRRGCPKFAHEIVCLRCACKPMNSSSSG